MPSSTRHSRDLSFLLLGGGAVALELHLPALRRLGALRRTRVVEPNPEIGARVRQGFAEVQVEQASFDAYLERCTPDAGRTLAIVALPNHLHAVAVEGCLRRGMHVLCEKPLALDAATCLRLHALAAEHGRTLAVGMVRRHLPSVAALRSALADGLIGRLERVEIAHGGAYAWPAASRAPFEARNGGVLADMGIHYLDLAEHLFGALEPVAYRDDCRGGVEANCELELRGPGELPIRLALSRTHALANTLRIIGSSGELEAQVDAHDGCTWHKSGGQGMRARLTLDRPFSSGDWPPTFRSCFVEQLERTAQGILEGSPSTVSAADAARTVGLVEWCYTRREQAAEPDRAAAAHGRPTLRPSEVTVTGATGFIGQHLVERLVDLGFGAIRAPVRSYGSCAGLARFGVDLQRVDLLDPAQVARAVAGARHVFHLAYGRDGSDASRITVEGTRNVVEAAIAAGAQSVVVLSTMYVFGHPNTDAPVDESSGYAPTGGEYGASKARMEKWCLERARSSPHTRIVVLNPSCVYGPGGGAYTELPARLAGAGRFAWIEAGRGMANYTYVDNLVDAILLTADRPEAHGRRFLINDGTCTWREFLAPLLGSRAASLPSYTARELEVPPGAPANVGTLVRHLASDLELIGIVNRMPLAGRLKRALLKKAPAVRGKLIDLRTDGGPEDEPVADPPHPPRWIADLYGPTRTRFSSDAARRLGWQPRVQLAEGQQRAVAWLRTVGAFC